MKWERIAIRGLGPFVEETSVDLGVVAGPIVAVTGPNGSGKSTLLELLAGALYRRTPTRGSLAELATARDAFVEVEVLNRQRWTVRQTVDAHNGKGEALVLDEAGSPVLPSGKVREADAWIASHLPPPEVLYSSVFAPQGSGGFLELKPAERKAVLLRVLGIERLEALAEQARERVRGTRGQADVLAARIADERERGGDIDEATNALEEARTTVERAGEDLAAARQELAAIEAEAEQAREEQRAEQEVQRRMAELRTRVSDAHSRGEELELRIRNNRRVLEESDTIRAAVKRRDELVAADADNREARASRSERVDSLRRAHGEAASRQQTAEITAERAGREATDAERKASERRQRVEAAEAAIEQLRANRDAIRREDEAVASQLERERSWQLEAADHRIGNLRDGLAKIAEPSRKRDGGPSAQVIARDTLSADDQAVAKAEAQPALIADLQQQARERAAELVAAGNELTDAERAAASGRESLQHLQAAVESALERQQEALEGAKAAAAEAAELAAELDAQQQQLARLDAVAQANAAELEQLAPLSKRAQALDNAEARLAELEPQLEETQAQGTAAQWELRELEESQPPGYEPPSVPEVAPLRRRVEELERGRASAEAAVSVIEARLASAKAAAKRLAELEAERVQLDIELADWTRLAEDLGRDGLQALEIDAAGPELTELINDLLRSCVGSRWTVTVETTRTSADGKRQLEGCEVRVLDAERGRDGTAESLSGGERVLVGEAVSLALSMLACRRAGVQGPTLVRDESGAALDPEKGPAYIAMLRRAADIVGASHVLFVSHSAELHELADARIVVSDGRLEVQA